MAAAARRMDMTVGHCYVPTPVIQASGDVLINGKGAARMGDSILPHYCPSSNDVHGGAVSMGSPTVFMNGRPAARVGDPISCGDRIRDGSNDVFTG